MAYHLHQPDFSFQAMSSTTIIDAAIAEGRTNSKMAHDGRQCGPERQRKISLDPIKLLSVACWVFLLLQCLGTTDALGSVPEGFISEVVTDTKAMSGTFAPNPRLNNQPMMVLNEKNGRVHVLENPDDSPESIEILDLGGNVCTFGEQGLHSMIPHPDFANNRWMYAFYTKIRGDCEEDPVLGPWNVVERFTMDATTLQLNADEGVEIWRGPSMNKRLHNGGALAFGNDGKLYITTGDGGERTNAGTLQNVHGCILRLNEDGTIPLDNPFTTSSGYPNSYRCADSEGRVPSTAPSDAVCGEIFAYGLRNPFRISMDSNTVDKVLFAIGDVGAQDIEALYFGGSDYSGANYGWPTYEGGVCVPADTTVCGGLADPKTVSPFHWYGHISFEDGGCVAGSAFVPQGLWPDQYKFLFIDFVFLKVYNLELDKPERACMDCSPPVPPTRNETFYRSFRKEGENVNEARMTSMWFGPYKDGMALYLSKFGNKETIVRVRYTEIENNKPPNPLFDFTYETKTSVKFDAGRSFDPDNDALSYEWDFGDGSQKIAGVEAVHEYTKPGEYNAMLVVTDSQGQSQQDFKKVKIGEVPTVTILSPAEADLFSVGEILTLQGNAVDAEGNPIPDEQLEWEVRQHHADHFHPFLDLRSGNNFELYPAPEPEDYLAATNSFLRVMLTATDSNGLSNTVSTDVQPRIVKINVQTEPQGMDVFVDEYSIETPQNISSWVGFDLPLHVDDQPPYQFKSWSDGNTNRTRTVTMLSSVVPQEFRAVFCLELQSMCTTNDDCCSGHCDTNSCTPAPLTEAPSDPTPLLPPANPPSFPPQDPFASLTSQPSVEAVSTPTTAPAATFVVPPALPTTNESPPLDIDVEKPFDLFDDSPVTYNDGSDTVSASANEANSTPNKSSRKSASSRTAWLTSFMVILFFTIVGCYLFRRCRRRGRKEEEYAHSALDSFYGGLSVEKDFDKSVEEGPEDDIEEGNTVIKATGTGSTDESERSGNDSGSRSTERRKNTGKQLDLPVHPATVDLAFLPRGSAPLSLYESVVSSSEDSQACPNRIDQMSVLTPESASACDDEQSSASEMSSILQYPVPYVMSGLKSESGSNNEESVEADESARFGEGSLLLEPSCVSMTGSHLDDLDVIASVEQSTEDLLSFMMVPPSELLASGDKLEEAHLPCLLTTEVDLIQCENEEGENQEKSELTMKDSDLLSRSDTVAEGKTFTPSTYNLDGGETVGPSLDSSEVLLEGDTVDTQSPGVLNGDGEVSISSSPPAEEPEKDQDGATEQEEISFDAPTSSIVDASLEINATDITVLSTGFSDAEPAVEGTTETLSVADMDNVDIPVEDVDASMEAAAMVEDEPSAAVNNDETETTTINDVLMDDEQQEEAEQSLSMHPVTPKVVLQSHSSSNNDEKTMTGATVSTTPEKSYTNGDDDYSRMDRPRQASPEMMAHRLLYDDVAVDENQDDVSLYSM